MESDQKPTPRKHSGPRWERPRTPRQPIAKLTENDTVILRAVFKHRYLRPFHLHLLTGRSLEYLTKRCRALFDNGYLERPRAQQSTRALTEQILYGIGRRGATYLAQEDPVYRGLKIEGRNLVETPSKRRSWVWIEHQLGVTTFMVLLQVACDRAGYVLHWDGQPAGGRYLIKSRKAKDTRCPDAYFAIEFPAAGYTAHYFLEYDRGTHPETMHQRYADYLVWWHERLAEEAEEPVRKRSTWAHFSHFRLLTVTDDEPSMNRLREEAWLVGNTAETGPWGQLRFSHLGLLDLTHPESILGPVFYYTKPRNPNEPQAHHARPNFPSSFIPKRVLRSAKPSKPLLSP